MPNLYEYFQSLSTREGTSINESFICCIKCFNHGINKIFNRKNVKELKSHLLDFHAIVADVNNKLQESNSYIPEITNQDELTSDINNMTKDTQKGNTKHRPSISKFFETDENGERLCKLCEADNVFKKYKKSTATGNLRHHLERTHGYSDATISNNAKPRNISAVWKYFCKSKKNGKIVNNDFVFCGKCLEKKRVIRYRTKTSTSVLRKHLLTEHSINPSDDEGESRSDVSNIKINLDVVKKDEVQKRFNELGFITKYFKDDKGCILCVVCEEEGQAFGFSKDTAKNKLKRHLIVTHQIDPMVEVTDEMVQKAQYTIEENPSQAKCYFIKINATLPAVYCCFCLVKRTLHGYKQATSESNLKLHLTKIHNLELGINHSSMVESDLEEKNSPLISVDKKTLEQAKSIIRTNGLKPRDYFIQIPNRAKRLIFCVFCLVNGKQQRYSINTSRTNLNRHLTKKHDFNSKKDIPLDDVQSEVSSELQEVNGTFEAEDEETESLNHLEPVQKVLLPSHVSTISSSNTKYCRSCGNYNVSFFTKFTSKFQINTDDFSPYPNLTLGQVYTEITGVQTSPDDGMSQSICFACEANLKTAYHFKLQANKTEKNMIQKFSNDMDMSTLDISMTSIKCEMEGDNWDTEEII